MNHFYSRIPSASVFREVDGNLYARIPHRLEKGKIVEDFNKTQTVRFMEHQSFMKNGEAYVYFGRAGTKIRQPVIPFSVTVEDRTGEPVLNHKSYCQSIAPDGWTFVDYENGRYMFQTGSYASGFKVIEAFEEDLTKENLALMAKLGVTRT